MAFADLRQLRDAMRADEIAVYSQRFAYNGIQCYLAMCLLTEEDRKQAKYKYALVRIRIMKMNNLLDFIDCPANSNGLDIRKGVFPLFLCLMIRPKVYAVLQSRSD